MATTLKVTDHSFNTDVLKAKEPVLVDFWADWCGPCKAIAPSLEELAAEMQGRLKIAKLNVDENPMTPTTYGLKGVPTLMIFKNGQLAASKVGALPKSMIKQWIESVIAS